MKIAVIGAGKWGKNHIRTLQSLNTLGGIVELSESTRQRFQKEYPDTKIFSDVKSAVEAGMDAFVVATPAETHFEIASFLLKNKKPVLVEKPMTLDPAESKRLVAIASENQVQLMVGHVLLFHPAIQKIKELIDDGKIGKLQYIYSNRLNLGTVRSEENVFWSLAPHDISIFKFLIGENPIRVSSSGGAFLQKGIQDTTISTYTYPDNIKAHIFVSWLHPFKEHRLVIIGSEGMLSFEDSDPKKEILFYQKSFDWIEGAPVKRDGPTEVIPYERAMPLTQELEYFIQNMHSGIEVADGQNGLDVVEILVETTKALQENDTTTKEPAKPEFFVHDSAIVDDNCRIGDGTKIWHFSHIQSGTRIGKACSLGQNVNVGNKVKIGNHVKIQNNVSVYEGVELEDYVFCGPSMVFTNVIDPRSKYPQRGSEHYGKTLVKEGASIGANATILSGVTIGRNAFVAAGAVLSRDCPDYALMKGIPAKQSAWICECGEVLKKSLICQRCSREYQEINNKLEVK